MSHLTSSEWNDNRREYYRLRLPHGAQLVAVIQGLPFKVLDISERGMRLDKGNVPHSNHTVQGVVNWNHGSHSYFIGQLGRINKGNRIVHFVSGISTRDILNEQRHLIRKYPLFR
jgi:hypothetical protein